MLASPDFRRDERALVAALRAGDELTYAALHERYHDRLVALAVAHGCTRASAEEIAQETWAVVVRGIHRFEGRCSVKTWVFRILVDGVRAHLRRDQRFVTVPDLSVRAGTAHSPHELAVWHETVAKVKAAIAGLAPLQRDVIVLRDVYGWSREEVSERLGITDDHQRVLLHRARAAVVAALEGQFDADELSAAA